MNDLQQYFAGREQFIELLEAVGIRTLEQFASADPFTVLPELHQAKRMLKLRTEIPPAPVFREWVNQALAMPTAPEPAALHASADGSLPLATPVVELAPAVKTAPRTSGPGREKRPRPRADGPAKHLSTKARRQEEQSYQPAKRVHVRQEPKTYLRKKGVKHMTPFRTWLGAASVLLLFVCTLFSIAIITLVLLNGERGWLIISLCFGPWFLALILYLSLALPRKCSVCRAHVFSFKNTPATRRPIASPSSATYLPRLCIYSSSAGSGARPAVPPSSWRKPARSSTNTSVRVAPSAWPPRDLPSFLLRVTPGKRLLSCPAAARTAIPNNAFPALCPIPGPQIRIQTGQTDFPLRIL